LNVVILAGQTHLDGHSLSAVMSALELIAHGRLENEDPAITGTCFDGDVLPVPPKRSPSR
jgi:hypothetical protein